MWAAATSPGVAAEQRVAGAAEHLADEVPDGEVDGAAGDVVGGDPAERSATFSVSSGSRPTSSSASVVLTVCTIEACVSP